MDYLVMWEQTSGDLTQLSFGCEKLARDFMAEEPDCDHVLFSRINSNFMFREVQN